MAGATERVFERLVAIQGIHTLVGPSYPLPPGQRRPLAFFEGRHGSGKTQLLEDLAALCDQHVPYGRVDFAEARHDDIPHTLTALAGQLEQYRPRYGRLRFHRLLIGLLVMEQPLGPLHFEQAREAVERLLRQRRGGRWPQGFLSDHGGQPPQLQLTFFPATLLLSLNALSVLTGFRFTRRSRRWFGHRDRGLTGAAVDTLVELNTWAWEARQNPTGSRGAEARGRVADLLCEAFLADLRDCPRRVRGLNTPLLLLDNVDTPAGRAFLRRLLGARPPLGPADRAEPLTVVTTGRGPLPEMSEGTVAEFEEALGGSRPRDAAHPAWLRYPLPDLTRADIQRLMDDVSSRGRVDRRLARLVHEFTAGHPEAAGVLAKVAARPPHPADGVGQLLARTAPADEGAAPAAARTAGEWLLSRLLPGPGSMTAAFATCAAARDETGGLWLSHQSDLVDAAWGDEVRRAAPWATEGEAGAAVLRRLLLHRLAAPGPGRPADWATVHERLRGFCVERDDKAGELYHRLAMDDLAGVASELAALLPTMTGQEWLDLVHSTAQAPLGPAERQLMDPYALFHACVDEARTASLDATATHVVDLLAALRIVGDPLCGVSREYLYSRITTTLNLLDLRSSDGLVAVQRTVTVYDEEKQWWTSDIDVRGQGPASSTAAVVPGFKNPPRHGTGQRLVAAGTVGALLVAVVALWLPDRLDCDRSDLTERGGECLGVTDGSFAFVPSGEADLAEEFREVQRLIKEENDRVVEQGDASVKVGLLATLTPDDTGPQAPRRVLHALEGAYTAQMRANQTRQLGDPAPQIQLHLANAGSRHEQWGPAVDGLVSMADDSAPLVAVVGLSISTEDSRAAAQRLADHGIPVISSSASADGLNSETVPGLVRVTASNTDFVTALRQYVRGREGLDEAILVYDRNAPDLHVATLTEAFRELMADELGANPDQPFQGTTVAPDTPAALFDAAVLNVCHTEADMVLFAGRTGDLHAFTESLHNRACRDEPIAVLFVETGPVVDAGQEQRLAENNITVVQASAMDPEWARNVDAAGAPPGFRGFFEQYDTHVPYADDVPAALEDGYAVANHDALATAVRAIRVSHAQDPEAPMTSGRVGDALFLLNLGNAVEAASGTLHFTTDRHGDPGGKPVPVLETPPSPSPPELHVTPVP
ncbi:ABC transporter substrate-binding protein [Streptomyces radicis]|uniref:Uncharacterized protein n=1 Tax=Streptomyces radicis TaxID=1750517 RepID=A0A3A9WC33_9ACTN|nr:ABC transporter substrate-binding protein [Streptomyces radicis]RKN10555.1 hypothetical protein D7319_08995 [Streptomyces radicis]RKN24815.1 hypothetical protein D7318_10175 [Streptomyces radicis]